MYIRYPFCDYVDHLPLGDQYHVCGLSSNPHAHLFFIESGLVPNWTIASANAGLADLLLMPIHRTSLHWGWLSLNSNPRIVTELLSVQLDRVNWNNLSLNPSALSLLTQYPHLINWSHLSRNTSDEIIHWLLHYYPERADWSYISANPTASAVHYLCAHPERIDWDWLLHNPNPDVVPLLLSHRDAYTQEQWNRLQEHAYAFTHMHIHPPDYDFHHLSKNPSEEAMNILTQHVEHIDWFSLSSNPSEGAMDLLAQHIDRVYWDQVSMNPRLFVGTYVVK